MFLNFLAEFMLKLDISVVYFFLFKQKRISNYDHISIKVFKDMLDAQLN